MPKVDVRQLAQQAGFQGKALDTIVAIVMAESGGNPQAYNGNAHTGDKSYGLAQINMLGAMGPERRKQYGLSSNEDLFDPLTNLKVAYRLSNGGKNFAPWTTYTSGKYRQFLGSSGANIRVSERTGQPALAGSPQQPLGMQFAPDAPIGIEAATAPGVGAAAPVAVAEDDDDEPFLPPMTRQVWDNIFAPVESAPSYGPESRGPAMRQEDITAVGGKRGKVARLARSFVGTPYVWGGTSPDGFDCSGFVQYVYRKIGVELPRVSYQQANAGRRISLKELQPGDLVAWDNSSRNAGADHIAIYLGGGLVAESPRPGVPNRVRKLGRNEGAWGVRVLD